MERPQELSLYDKCLIYLYERFSETHHPLLGNLVWDKMSEEDREIIRTNIVQKIEKMVGEDSRNELQV